MRPSAASGRATAAGGRRRRLERLRGAPSLRRWGGRRQPAGSAPRILLAPGPWARRSSRAAARRAADGACCSSSRSARLAAPPAPLPSQLRPRGGQRRRLRELLEEGGARLGGGHAAGTGPGRSREEGAAAAPPCLRVPGPGRERERRVAGSARARSGSCSAARRSGPHVTGGGPACSWHRPGGGRRLRGWGLLAARDADPAGREARREWALTAAPGLRGSPGWVRLCLALYWPCASRISFSSLVRRTRCVRPLTNSAATCPFPSPCTDTVMELAEFRGLGFIVGA